MLVSADPARAGVGDPLVPMGDALSPQTNRPTPCQPCHRIVVETPLTYFEEGSDLVLIASKGGSPQHPAWYLNLIAEPEVRARVGSVERDFHAEPVADVAERDRLYAKAEAIYHGYADHERKTYRKIPVVRLTSKPACDRLNGGPRPPMRCHREGARPPSEVNSW